MRHAVNVLNNRTCLLVERYSPNMNPHYKDFRVMYGNGEYRIVKERHMRKPFAGEVRHFRQCRATGV